LPVTLLAKTSSTVSYGVAFKTMATPQFWFSILMVTVILLLPVMLNRFFWFDTHPSFADRLRVRKKLGKKFPQPKEEEEKPAFKRSAATRRSVRGSLRSGYAFSHSQGFGDLILKGKLFKNVEQMRSKNNGYYSGVAQFGWIACDDFAAPTSDGGSLPTSFVDRQR
ncbi:hypothetical protein TELCIR_20412, partial [Teladorsagia circumcincta]